MKKKKLFMAVSVVCLVVMTMITAFAYFTKVSNSRDNTLTIGYDSVEISEEFTPPEKQTEVTSYKKAVSVKNNGTVPCFARVYVDFSDSDIRDISYFSQSDSSEYYSATRDKNNAAAYINHLPDGWVFVAENENSPLSGYYYYTKAIEPDDSSALLFSYVKTDYTQSDIGIRQYDIIVYAESLQTVTQDSKDHSNEPDGWRTAWMEFLSEE